MDWSHSAQDIVRRVRAFNPQPGTSTLLDGVALKIWAARVGEALAPGFHVYGEIMAIAPDGIAVAAMDSIVVLTELQRAGGKRLPVADFLRGCALRVGQQLG